MELLQPSLEYNLNDIKKEAEKIVKEIPNYKFPMNRKDVTQFLIKGMSWALDLEEAK
jgi:hypothetical protein